MTGIGDGGEGLGELVLELSRSLLARLCLDVEERRGVGPACVWMLKSAAV